MNFEPEAEWLRTIGVFHTCYVANPHLLRQVYVDLGCAHPVNKSLTHLCREVGWRGVAVDGNPAYAQDWAQAGLSDHFHLAILSDKPSVRFALHENSFTSRISDGAECDHPEKWGLTAIVNAPTTPLKEILAQHAIAKIDLLTVDLEGAEHDVLTTLDFELHQPEIVVVEYVTEGIGIDCRAANLLIEKGYRLIQMFPSNLIFKRQ